MTKRTARWLSVGAWSLALWYSYLAVSAMFSATGRMWLTPQGYVAVSVSVVMAPVLADIVSRYLYRRVRCRSRCRPVRRQRRERWRGDEYQGSHLDYSYLRDDPTHEAKQRTI
jgi:hypothetical protein